MLTIASLLAAMTIAGAFWVGILAARRLRDWGDGRQALEAGEAGPQLALAAATPGSPGNSHPPRDPASQRVRARVAERITGRSFGGRVRREEQRELDQARVRNQAGVQPEERDLDLTGLRQGDVVVIDSSDVDRDGDYLIDGVVNLREGATTTVIAVLNDAGQRRWLVGSPDRKQWLLLEPVSGHGLVGEPPRHVQHGGFTYALERRGQASAAGVGMHGRPALPRVATYLYRCEPDNMLWLERWADQILMGAGIQLPAHFVSFLPGQG